jgi:uncharacterized coiled-coil protein SlyX
LIDLLGKGKLESQIHELELRIATLEKEREDLQHKIDKREDKIKKLNRAHQEARLSLKAAEKKLDDLMDKTPSSSLDKFAPEERSSPPDYPEETIRKLPMKELAPAELARLITRLRACRSPEEELVTAYLREAPFETSKHPTQELKDLEEELPQEIFERACKIRSDRGVMILYHPYLFGMALVPPVPVEVDILKFGNTFDLSQLRTMMETPILVVLAHAGETFLGVALSKEGFETYDIVSSQVKEKHSKGGWSQRRFERLREEDIRLHAEMVKERIPPLVEEYNSLIRYAVLGGDSQLIKLISSAIKFPTIERRIARFDKKRIDQVLDDVYGFQLYRL